MRAAAPGTCCTWLKRRALLEHPGNQPSCNACSPPSFKITNTVSGAQPRRRNKWQLDRQRFKRHPPACSAACTHEVQSYSCHTEYGNPSNHSSHLHHWHVAALLASSMSRQRQEQLNRSLAEARRIEQHDDWCTTIAGCRQRCARPACRRLANGLRRQRRGRLAGRGLCGRWLCCWECQGPRPRGPRPAGGVLQRGRRQRSVS